MVAALSHFHFRSLEGMCYSFSQRTKTLIAQHPPMGIFHGIKSVASVAATHVSYKTRTKEHESWSQSLATKMRMQSMEFVDNCGKSK